MPKVIKSDAVIEEQSPFIVDLPAFSMPTEQNAALPEMDDLDFFKNLELADADDSYDEYFAMAENQEDTSFLKYYSNLDQPEDDQTYEKYFLTDNEINDEERDEAAPAEEITEEADAQREIETEAAVPTIQEREEQIIESAQERAHKIIDEAKKEAENLRLKLVAEISEAEVKKELAKSIAQSTVDDAHAEADKIIETANEAAKEIQKKAKNEGHAEGLQAGTDEGYKAGVEKGLEEGRRTGHDKGHREGFAVGDEKGRAEGYSIAYAEMAKKISEATQKAKNILLEAQKEKERIINSSDGQILEISMAVAGKILNKEFSENPFSILQIVKDAIGKVSDQPRIFITVSADNYDLVNTTLDEIKKTFGTKQEMSVVADTTLGPGDVIIGTGGGGDVDARLETQLNEIRKTIEMVMHQ